MIIKHRAKLDADPDKEGDRAQSRGTLKTAGKIDLNPQVFSS